MYIGEVAKRTGLSAKAIRYYEDLGLLASPKRAESGYRVYGAEDEERLRFIQGAKALGLSLEEIREIVQVWSSGTPPCAHVSRLLDEKLHELDRRIRELSVFRDDLRAYKARVDASKPPSDVPCAHVLGAMQGLFPPKETR